ncbi:hypothetical protein GMST_21370 [Geomonas silvestris]|uniref:DUF948 domain-containing protein n=1 Tax=Geomonas silvestris TaxID=2740184 RepID=A0A6V8MIL2_9BACT|nr:DUF948 domain-containing protein [Geomonas silvestris]GFO59812.1 hypothetical protein GMST_21370 [Geomonas silvestris]
MLFLEITSAVTALTLVVLAFCLIPVLLELKQTAISLRTFSDTLQLELKPLIKDLRDTVADVKVVTNSAAANADGINLFMEELGHAGHNIRMINRVIGVASTIVSGSSGWLTGARVAGKFIADRLLKKKGG